MELGNIWKPEYMLAIEEIDSQHKGFLSLVSKLGGLIDSAQSGKKVKIANFFKTLFMMRKYAFKHFFTEESLLTKHAYPGLFEHLDLHNKYIIQSIEIVDRMRPYATRFSEDADEAFLNEMQSVSEFILQWWTSHISEEDTKYAKHIRERLKKKVQTAE